MKKMKISKAFTLMESGPVVFVTTGPWNYSYAALRKARECVISIPSVDLIDQVVGVGTCSGADTDKFVKFGLTPVKGKHVRSPLIKECLANIACIVKTRERFMGIGQVLTMPLFFCIERHLSIGTDAWLVKSNRGMQPPLPI